MQLGGKGQDGLFKISIVSVNYRKKSTKEERTKEERIIRDGVHLQMCTAAKMWMNDEPWSANWHGEKGRGNIHWNKSNINR